MSLKRRRRAQQRKENVHRMQQSRGRCCSHRCDEWGRYGGQPTLPHSQKQETPRCQTPERQERFDCFCFVIKNDSINAGDTLYVQLLVRSSKITKHSLLPPRFLCRNTLNAGSNPVGCLSASFLCESLFASVLVCLLSSNVSGGFIVSNVSQLSLNSLSLSGLTKCRNGFPLFLWTSLKDGPIDWSRWSLSTTR